MASNALLKVRFPDGTIRYGYYNATSDVPYEALTSEPENWEELLLHPATPLPEGTPDNVEIACDYGGGSHWPGTAFPDRLVDTGLTYDGRGEALRTPETPGYPGWYEDDANG